MAEQLAEIVDLAAFRERRQVRGRAPLPPPPIAWYWTVTFVWWVRW